jgi:hypothetical protein
VLILLKYASWIVKTMFFERFIACSFQKKICYNIKIRSLVISRILYNAMHKVHFCRKEIVRRKKGSFLSKEFVRRKKGSLLH